jgi:outer membrane protein assembly factor BamB
LNWTDLKAAARSACGRSPEEPELEMKMVFRVAAAALCALVVLSGLSCMYRTVSSPVTVTAAAKPTAAEDSALAEPAEPAPPSAAEQGLVGKNDWNQWAGSSERNNTPDVKNIPHEWDIDSGKDIKWVARLGSQTYGNPVIANGQVYVGTNNGAGWLKRYPPDVDLGCLLAFRESDGQFLWQHSSEKLPTGRVHDWPYQGICAAPLVEGERLWFVTSRGEVRCLDTKGFHDEENDGPYKDEVVAAKDEADVIWVLDMMSELGISQHNMCSCSVTCWGDILFVITGNGVDDAHIVIPAPEAPSFVAVDKNTGKVLWTDNSPGLNIVHGQWSSPAVGILGGVPQVIFGGGDGYMYSFRADAGKDAKGELLWKFDLNPKEAKWELGGRGDRNEPIATPVLYKGRVYIPAGQDPEHMEGDSRLWCIDPTKRGDVSPQLVYNSADPDKPIGHKRIQACEKNKGDFTRDNPNSAAIWEYARVDVNGDGKINRFEEKFHRGIGTVAIKDDVLYVADFSGLVHCVDANTGKRYWVHDMLAASWGSMLIADGKVFIGDEDGDVTIFAHHAKPSSSPEILAEINMGSSVYSTPVVANGVLFISTKRELYAIEQGARSTPPKPPANAGGNEEQ